MATSTMFSLPSISGSDEVHERVCSLCSEEDKDVVAVELCLDCEQFLCRSCSVQHGRFKSLQKHKVVQKDQVPNLSLSVLTGSETATSECTVCSMHGRYIAARVYCVNCCKCLCSVCENNHNQFELLRNHKVKTVEEIRTEVSKSNNEDCQYAAIVEKPIRQEKLSCTSCKMDIEDTQQPWKCVHCGFRNICQKCCGLHQSSNEGHRLIPFKEFKVIYQQYGKYVISGSEEFMGPVCSKCCEKGSAKYPHMLCTECNIFVCISCKEDHASHRTESKDALGKAKADEVVQMKNIDHDCSICLDMNMRSSAAGYCLKCDIFICVCCTTMHTIYFGQESHHIRGLREINLQKEVFFKKMYSTNEVIIDRCDSCSKKDKTTAAAWKCLDCRKSLCIPCSDFHEIANVGHNLRIVRTEEEIKGQGDSKVTHKYVFFTNYFNVLIANQILEETTNDSK
jgi:hypothetical protein